MDGLHKRNNQIIAEVITGYWAVITPAGLCSCPAKSEKITEDITETRKYIIKIPRPAVTAVFQAIMPVGIIYLSLLIITEHFVRLSAFLEFGLTGDFSCVQVRAASRSMLCSSVNTAILNLP